MPSLPRFLIYTHAASEVGYGHLNRCLILGDALKRSGCDVQILVRGDEAARLFAGERPWVVVRASLPVEWPDADICLVDCYIYEREFYKNLRRHYQWITIFDDIRYEVPDSVSAVINANLYGSSDYYPRGIQVFAGSQYIMVRPEFIETHKNSEAADVLICVGGSDPTGQMDRLIGLATQITARQIHAVYGPLFEHSHVIRKWERHDRVVTHHAPRKLALLLKQSAYAVTGGGSMLYELAAMGVPAVSVALADNQRILAEAMDRVGSVCFVGSLESTTDADIGRAIEKIDGDQQYRDNMAQQGRLLIDGRGADRLAFSLVQWICVRKDATQTPYTRADVEAEYAESARSSKDHERLRWGSHDSMINRYELVTRELPFEQGGFWIDVGCGTGLLQQMVGERYQGIRGVGIELSPSLFAHAVKRAEQGIDFVCCDFLDYQGEPANYLTCLGVLVKSHMNLGAFVRHAAELTRKDGWLLVDFKNLNWKKFREKDFFPEVSHLWFRPEEVIDCFVAGNLFNVHLCAGFLPSEGRVVELEESHTFFLVLRRTSVPSHEEMENGREG